MLQVRWSSRAIADLELVERGRSSPCPLEGTKTMSSVAVEVRSGRRIVCTCGSPEPACQERI